MIRPLELYIGLRYTRAKRRNQFISFISIISMLGIALGVWALITVLSIMNGFERELRGRILNVASHVTVQARAGWLEDWRGVLQKTLADQRVLAGAPFILGQGLVSRGKNVSGVLVRGILPDQEIKITDLFNELREGSLDDLKEGEFRIVLGSRIASKLGVGVGSRVTLIAPEGQITPAGMLPRLKRFVVSGVFDLKMYEYDSGLVFIHMADAAKLFRTKGNVSGVRLTLDDVYQAQSVRKTLAEFLDSRFLITDWTREHANFFAALKIEKRVMFIILLLIVAVAAFNIVSTLVMLVTDKQSDIAILKTLGLSPMSTLGVFIVQGCVIGVVGTLTGGILGVITALNVETLVPWLETLFGIEFFPDDIYVITDFPAELHWSDVYRILAASLFIGLVATIYPAWRASRVQPADALRYE